MGQIAGRKSAVDMRSERPRPRPRKDIRDDTNAGEKFCVTRESHWELLAREKDENLPKVFEWAGNEFLCGWYTNE